MHRDGFVIVAIFLDQEELNGSTILLPAVEVIGKTETDEPRRAPLRPEAKIAIDEWLSTITLFSRHCLCSVSDHYPEIFV
jgi:hypothetical protein